MSELPYAIGEHHVRLPFLFVAFVVPVSVNADDVKFVDPPTVKQMGDKFEVRFAVSQGTDFEVSIYDKENRIVRVDPQYAAEAKCEVPRR